MAYTKAELNAEFKSSLITAIRILTKYYLLDISIHDMYARLTMKVLLVFPYKIAKFEHRLHPVEPLGILSVATYIKQEMKDQDVDVRILDALFQGPATCTETELGFRVGMLDEEIVKYLRDFEPDLVGISNSYTFNTHEVLALAALIKTTLPDCKVILGGAHATIDHDNLIKDPNIDLVVRGEGEIIMKNVITAMQTGSDFSDVKGATYKNADGVQVNEDAPLIPDIDVLPIPDRTLVPYRDYLALTSKHYFQTKNSPVGTIFTSRGCPYKCIFCSTQKVWRNKWRPRSPEKMFEEVELLVNEYGVKEIAFQDDQLIGNKERIKEFCRLIIKSSINITFIAPPGISPALIDVETIDLMQQAGFYRLCFSVDVGTEKARKYVKKPVKLETIREMIKSANSRGLWTYGPFVIGFPFETVEDIKQTIKFAYSLKLDFVIFYIALPHMGSEFYDIYEEAGKINPDTLYDEHLIDEALFGTDHISPEDLEAIRNKAAKRYLFFHLLHFLNPVYVIQEFLPKIATRERFMYFLTLLPSLLPRRRAQKHKKPVYPEQAQDK